MLVIMGIFHSFNCPPWSCLFFDAPDKHSDCSTGNRDMQIVNRFLDICLMTTLTCSVGSCISSVSTFIDFSPSIAPKRYLTNTTSGPCTSISQTKFNTNSTWHRPTVTGSIDQLLGNGSKTEHVHPEHATTNTVLYDGNATASLSSMLVSTKCGLAFPTMGSGGRLEIVDSVAADMTALPSIVRRATVWPNKGVTEQAQSVQHRLEHLLPCLKRENDDETVCNSNEGILGSLFHILTCAYGVIIKLVKASTTDHPDLVIIGRLAGEMELAGQHTQEEVVEERDREGEHTRIGGRPKSKHTTAKRSSTSTTLSTTSSSIISTSSLTSSALSTRFMIFPTKGARKHDFDDLSSRISAAVGTEQMAAITLSPSSTCFAAIMEPLLASALQTGSNPAIVQVDSDYRSATTGPLPSPLSLRTVRRKAGVRKLEQIKPKLEERMDPHNDFEMMLADTFLEVKSASTPEGVRFVSVSCCSNWSQAIHHHFCCTLTPSITGVTNSLISFCAQCLALTFPP